MKKRITCFIICALMLCTGLLHGQTVSAAYDPAQPCTLTLYYSRSETACPDLTIRIYRVAALCDDGSYALLPPYDQYPINIYGITSQQEWRDVAQTVKSYVAANHIEPNQTQTTNAHGAARFTDLESGLYLVQGVSLTSGHSAVTFHDFMIYLPTPTNSDYDYDVEAKPKSTEHTNSTTYTVIKLWKGESAADKRPTAITADILKDGTVTDTVTLNSANNWSHSWEAAEGDGTWTVMEKDVPEGYNVTITGSETSFTIINTKTTPTTPNIPQTGDTAPLLLYVVILCISGLGLILLALAWMRDRNHEEKR